MCKSMAYGLSTVMNHICIVNSYRMKNETKYYDCTKNNTKMKNQFIMCGVGYRKCFIHRSILRHNLKYETHRKFQLKLDSDIFDNKHTDSMLSNHNGMSILYKRLYYNQHGGLMIDAYKFYNFRSGLVLFFVKYTFKIFEYWL